MCPVDRTDTIWEIPKPVVLISNSLLSVPIWNWQAQWLQFFPDCSAGFLNDESSVDARKEWTILRNYANNHRDRLKMPSERAASSTTSGGKRKKSEWEYAADMQFLLPLLGKHREMDSTMRKSSDGKKHLLLRQIVTF
ncbi:hypothetical protein PoB_004594300 [Plakobranchus ocellatus]|uniref:MADF domain-containing protein n=1 Tax=Plakobranchus ocellatus TaxID=259542 RepID=A0AAV4BKU6_9GAST|nr:hypothetical protein PoB_004594300 [Plakobranchus ocellatus]